METMRDLWMSLGLDVEAQERLMTTMGGVFREVIQGQEKRPRAMAYFDGAMAAVRGRRLEELLTVKKEGKPVVGTFCTYVPEEIVTAVGGTSVGLCAGSEVLAGEVEKVLPRNLCALIKSSYGFKLGKLCPVMEMCDLIVGETTCDGKKKYYEVLNDHVPVYVMELPQKKTERDRAFWREEVRLFASYMEERTGSKLTAEGLRDAMGLHNERRRALGRLGDLRKAVPSPLSGKDSLLVSQVAFYDDPERFTRNVHALCEEIEERVRNHEGIAAADAPRLLVTGCPMVAPNWKVPHILEKAGAVIAVEEMCTGVKYYRDLADETGETVEELLDAIADRYFNIDCAVFTPNRERVDHIRELVRDWRIDGVVYYTLQFCDPYSVEAHQVKSALASDGVPCLYIETDYSKEDVSQIATRAEAFLEMLRSARAEKA